MSQLVYRGGISMKSRISHENQLKILLVILTTSGTRISFKGSRRIM
jgi:hypothetical protein